MSEITTLRPGTREYYDSRQMPENPRKIELLKILEERIWREVAAQLPESEMPTEVEFSDPRLLGKHTEWFLAYHKRDKNTLIERVKNNVQSSYSEQLLGEDVSGESIMTFLSDLHDAIEAYPSPLRARDLGTQELGKDYAHMFVDGWGEQVRRRVFPTGHYVFPFQQTNDETSNPGPQRCYILTKLASLSGETRERAMQKFCEVLPYCDGSELTWQDMKKHLEEILNPSIR